MSGIARAGFRGPLRLLVLAGCVAAMALRAGAARPAETADVAWHPKNARIGDVAWLHVSGLTLIGSLVYGLTCSARMPDSSACDAVHSKIGRADFSSAVVVARVMK